jgi:hypothetical protein
MLYHLSTEKDIKTLTAQVPQTQLFEDNHTKRVCFSTSIDKCLTALMGEIGTYYVYIPKDENLEVYIPSTKQVFDSFLTDETWSLEDTDVECIGIIKNKGIIDTEEYLISRKPYCCRLRICDWEWIQVFDSSKI